MRFGGADVPAEQRLADLETSLAQVHLDPVENATLLAPLLDIPLPSERASGLAPEELRRRHRLKTVLKLSRQPSTLPSSRIGSPAQNVQLLLGCIHPIRERYPVRRALLATPATFSWFRTGHNDYLLHSLNVAIF